MSRLVWVSIAVVSVGAAGCEIFDVDCVEGLVKVDGECVRPDGGDGADDGGPGDAPTAECASASDCANVTRATARCEGGRCVWDCDEGWGDCDETPGCERPLDQLTDCGGCDVECDLANATESCGTTECELLECEDGFEDCDGDPSNGCEAELATDVAHCGECGNECVWQCGQGSCDDPVEVAVGGGHSCARVRSGRVYCWGANNRAQLGLGVEEEEPRLRPVLVPGLEDVVELECGSRHTVVRLVSGRVKAWGAGIAGDGSDVQPLSPTRVDGVDDATALGLGHSHYCAVRSDGTVSCWGINWDGQLGNGTTGEALSPVSVSDITDAVEVDGNVSSTCSRSASGELACWGANEYGELARTPGDGSSTPVTLPEPTDAAELTVGGAHVCARTSSAAVTCWGNNRYGQLGDGTTTEGSVTAPTTVTDLDRVVEIAAGIEHTCARTASGSVSCWGDNRRGNLGDGTATPARASPTPVLDLSDAEQLAGGFEHTCTLHSNGVIRCWGANGQGQIGDGTTDDRNTPTEVLPP